MKFDASEYKVENLPKLSAEDMAKPEAKYYLQGRREITDPVLLKAMEPGNELDIKDVIYPQDFIKIIQPDAPQPKVGYCLLPEGVAYACACIDFPDVTMEMEGWFMPWVMDDNKFRYKIWYPGSHEAHYDNYAIEDFGEGMMDLVLGKRPDMATIGLPDDPYAINPKLLRVMGRNGLGKLQSDPEDAPLQASVMIHMIFERDDGGLRRYSFGYTGAHLKDGKLLPIPCEGKTVTAENGRMQLVHLLYEYTNQAYILPRLYAEFGDQKPSMVMPPYPEDKIPLLKRAGLIK
jgi:hypothetical protein